MVIISGHLIGAINRKNWLSENLIRQHSFFAYCSGNIVPVSTQSPHTGRRPVLVKSESTTAITNRSFERYLKKLVVVAGVGFQQHTHELRESKVSWSYISVLMPDQILIAKTQSLTLRSPTLPKSQPYQSPRDHNNSHVLLLVRSIDSRQLHRFGGRLSGRL
jgi:hypothetical protein